MTRTVVKYPGAKWRISEWLINQMIDHKSYVEPYFGSGAVFFRKPPSRIETINDIDGDVVNLFACIRNDPEKLSYSIASTPYSREEYNYSYDTVSAEPFERARNFLLKHWQGHGFRTYCRSGWKNDVAGREYAYAVKYWNQLPDWIVEAFLRLKEAQIECRPAIEVIQRFNRPEVFIYADPPYLLSTRKMKKQYSHEMSESDHVELLTILLQHSGKVMLSGYDNELYNSMLSDWRKNQIYTTAEKGKPRIETVWLNY